MSLPCQVKDWFAPTRYAPESEIRGAVTGFPRPLSWADFRSVPRSLKSPALAQTGARFDYLWSGVHVVGNDYLVRGFRITVKPSHAEMWVVAGHRAPDLLKHEQGHYDITGLIGRDFARNVLSLAINIDVVGRMKEAGSTSASRQHWVHRLFGSAIDGFLKEGEALAAILQTDPRTQKDGLYDIQTKHGVDIGGQSQWNSRLRRLMTQNTSFRGALRAEGVIKQ